MTTASAKTAANQTFEDAIHLVAALRVYAMRGASEEFLRTLRVELQEWAAEIQSSTTTIPPPPPAQPWGEDLLNELHWSSVDLGDALGDASKEGEECAPSSK